MQRSFTVCLDNKAGCAEMSIGAIQQGLGFKEGACYGLALIEPFTVCLDNKAGGAEMSIENLHNL